MSVKISKVDTLPEIDPYHSDTQGFTLTCINIDPQCRECDISQEYDNNSTSEPVWNGRIIQEQLHGFLDGGQIETFLKSDEGQKLLDKICDEHSVDWNGNNFVGHMTDESEKELENLVNELESYGHEGEAWTCDEWFGNNSDNELRINKNTSDEEIKSLAKKYEDEADVYLVDDIETYLINRRNLIDDEAE
jgi:hypothetical protein